MILKSPTGPTGRVVPSETRLWYTAHQKCLCSKATHACPTSESKSFHFQPPGAEGSEGTGGGGRERQGGGDGGVGCESGALADAGGREKAAEAGWSEVGEDIEIVSCVWRAGRAGVSHVVGCAGGSCVFVYVRRMQARVVRAAVSLSRSGERGGGWRV